MKSPLHILHLEDDPSDVTLTQSILEAGGIECTTTRVQNRDEFVAALSQGNVDLILSDCALPSFDGMTALKIAHGQWPSIPLIFVSGTLGEERAIDSLTNGATDYVLKGHLTRLAPAVRRAMKEAEEREERRKLQEQFIEAQKMEVIGQLAGGVAHDFNNILAVIMGYCELATQAPGGDETVRGHLETIRAAAERATGLTRQLLIFSRKQTVQPVVLDLNEALKEMEKMLRRLVDENIEMKLVAGKRIGRVKADSGYVGQVLMNLAVNARDAMPNGGTLTIATENVSLSEDKSSADPGVPAGDYVLLSVSDTGTGMTPEVKARIFEAFFTTKPKGKGTGLGLTTCAAIMQQSGGHITIDTELGRGTTFRVYFPRVRQPLDTGTELIRKGPLPRGTETLLVVEDEPSVRLLARSVLEAQGFKVLAASNGQDALQVVREHQGDPIRLVVSDVVMPLMGGVVMAEWLKTSHSQLKILFTSGYSDDAITNHGVVEIGIEFLPKPYSPAVLVRKVREILDAPK